MSQTERMQSVIAALLIALGIATAGYFIGRTLYVAKVGVNTAEVKGLAERQVEADRAYWTIEYTVTGSESADIPALYAQSESDRNQIIALLTENGFDEAEIVPGVIRYEKKEFRNENQALVGVRHSLNGSIDVVSDNVALVARVRATLNQLIARGVDVKNNAPRYYFTRLNDIKPEMLQEATRNARLAANEFASNAGVSVGGIRQARQGGFIIRDIGEDYGDTAKIQKDVRVVTTITFYLQ